MAKAISSEELQLKKRARRRLVGAIALVLVVVIFLPMVLDNEPKPVSENIAINIPPPPDANELPAEADETSAADSSTDNTSATSSGSLRFTPVEPSPDTERSGEKKPEPAASTPPQQKPAAVSTPVESKPAPSRSSSAGFVVQLGAFSDAGNADRLAKTVRESRFDVYTEGVTTSGGKRTRVRVGPYPTRAEAEQARDRLKARKLTYGEPDIVRSDER
ncbi:MAG: hypothetical protein AMJ66_10615 [Betaproteobacteria bacterium SG8_40]|nr:MAG: hypothetical protein AMJ66_10615 [Betaproteobacteria bacterium SG8_40]